MTNHPMEKGVAKAPQVMAMESLECGAAALAMICAYYGKWMPLEQVRVDCGVSRDGASIENIAKAARSYGLEVEGYQRSSFTIFPLKESKKTDAATLAMNAVREGIVRELGSAIQPVD